MSAGWRILSTKININPIRSSRETTNTNTHGGGYTNQPNIGGPHISGDFIQILIYFYCHSKICSGSVSVCLLDRHCCSSSPSAVACYFRATMNEWMNERKGLRLRDIGTDVISYTRQPGARTNDDTWLHLRFMFANHGGRTNDTTHVP